MELKENYLDLMLEIAIEKNMSMLISIRIFCFFVSGRVDFSRKNSATEASTDAVMTTDKLNI